MISFLALGGVAFSTAALIIILSVFNGLEGLLRSINGSFDPQIKILPTTGKSFSLKPESFEEIKKIPGISVVTEVIEDYAYIRYHDANQIVTVKGVSENFIDQNRMEGALVQGNYLLKKENVNYALVGQGVQYNLGINLQDELSPLKFYYIKNGQENSLNPGNLYTQKSILAGGVFSIIQSLDENYVLVPLDFARDLMDYGEKRSSLEIQLEAGVSIQTVKKYLEDHLGSAFQILNPEEQHIDLYRLLKMEKLFTFLTFSLLILVSALNIFFSLTMLALDKKKDISILASLGAHERLIRQIFLTEGMMISFVGTAMGMILGILFCWLQMDYGLISMGMETAVSEAYPVKMMFFDFLTVFLTIFLITLFISLKPSMVASKAYSLHYL